MEKQNNLEFKNMIKGIGVILFYLIFSSTASEFLSIFGINFFKLNTTIQNTYLVFYQLSLTLIIIYIYRKDFIPNFKDFFKNKKNYLDEYFKYWIIMFILMNVSNIIITKFTTTLIPNNQKEIINDLLGIPIYTIIITLFIAPILEELVFRLTFRKIFAKTNFLFIFFSGLLFGSLHVLGTLNSLIDLLFIIPYSIPGFIFAYVYTKSKNIFVPISLHFIHNGLMLILQMFVILFK